MEYDAVVFDNDGVLTTLTERELLRRAIRETFEAHGVSDPTAADIEAMMHVTADEIEACCHSHGIEPASFWKRRDRLAAERQIEALRAGEKTLYDEVAEIEGLEARTGIVSNNQQRTVEHVVEQFDLDWAEVVYGREPTLDGVRRKKPTPYYLQRALDDLGLTVEGEFGVETTVEESVLYVGDSRTDLVAADRAGVRTAFVRRPHRRDTELPFQPAHEVPDLTSLFDRIHP
jgi:phosphoglycolate phosphatase-like HAD superfamily hydrolase